MISDTLLIRHGEAYNTAPHDGLREVLDHSNPPLTPLGERQADELRRLLEEFAPEAIVVSPFLRALQTIWPYVASAAIPVFVDIRFGEQFAHSVFGSFGGIDLQGYRKRFSARFTYDTALANRAAFPHYPETAQSVFERVRSLWLHWEQVEKGYRRVAFVGHGATLGALLSLLHPATPSNTGHVNCGASALIRAGDSWHPKYINRQDHLSESGAPAGLDPLPILNDLEEGIRCRHQVD